MDTLIVPLADMQSGGTTALFPNDNKKFKHGWYVPNDDQLEMFEHFEKCAKIIKKARKGKKLIIVGMGEAIDGVHHNTPQLVTTLVDEQIDIHVELVEHFKNLVGFDGRKDKTYYISSTESHTADHEETCAKKVKAQENPKGLYVYDELKKNVNGAWLWFSHHGPSAGKGPNKGNSQRNFLRDIYVECTNNELVPPDMVVTAHRHTPFYNIYIQEKKAGWHLLHGLICPSWQQKTRYAYKVASLQLNKVGLAYFTVLDSGDILKPRILIM